MFSRLGSNTGNDRHGASNAKAFADCTRTQRTRIDQLASSFRVPAGTMLTVQGSRRHELGILLDGTATVLVDGEPVNTIGPGDHYGELSLLAAPKNPSAPQTATVVADQDQWIATMSMVETRTMLSEFPELSAALLTCPADSRDADRRRTC